MDLIKYLSLLVVICFDSGETGGHGRKHHDHVILHLPEFKHHHKHTKVITIHHHHHKPKKEHHHHHHHHHPKPHIPYGHHYHHHHKKVHLKTTTVDKGHGHKGHHGHHGHHGHKHHGHHGHGHHGHGHHGHGHHGHGGHHHDAPSFDYDPTSYDEQIGSSYFPSAPSYGAPQAHIPAVPQVYGVQHTVKQVKVYDSLPGALGTSGNGQGYQVTEQGEDDEDGFTSLQGVPQTYPNTFNYLRSAAPQATHDPFAESPQFFAPTQNNIYAAAPAPTSADFGAGSETFRGIGQSTPYSSLSTPTQNTFSTHSVTLDSPEPTSQLSSTHQTVGFDDPGNAFTAPLGDNPSLLLASSEDDGFDGSPVTYSRKAGVQQVIQTGGTETLVY